MTSFTKLEIMSHAFSFLCSEISKMKRKDILSWDHHVASFGEFVHNNTFDEIWFGRRRNTSAFRDSDCQNKATSCQISNFLTYLIILNIIDFYIFYHQKFFECSHIWCPNQSFTHIGNYIQNSILTYSKNALGIGAELWGVTMEEGHSHVYNV